MDMKELRLRAGKKVEEVAIALGVATSTVHNWDQLRTTPRMSAKSFQKLMQLYECTFEELIAAQDEQESIDR